MAGIDPSLVLALQHGMAGYELTILEDPNLDRVVLDLDDPPPGGVRNAVLIATHRHHAFLADAAFDRQHSVVGTATMLNSQTLRTRPGSEVNSTWNSTKSTCACWPAKVSKRRSNCRGTAGRMRRRYSVSVE